MEYFNTTNYMIKKSRQLKARDGILPNMKNYYDKKGNILSQSQVKEVEQYYIDESRNCPGKKDCISFKNKDGEKETVQKRLILNNLKELHEEYKEHCIKNDSVPVGFSTFAQLRPVHCIIAGASGTHSVCVCTYHQNPKLMVAAIGKKDLHYSTLIDKSVCDSDNRSCMLHQCTLCPGVEGVKKYLQSIEHLSQCETISYSKWTTTDRSTIVSVDVTVEEFIMTLANSIHALTRHH